MQNNIMTSQTPQVWSSPTPDDYDYYNDSDGGSLMCDRGSVRSFRAAYEPPLFWLIAVVGGAGNLAVVWIYLHVRRRLKTMTDVYLLNLAVADLLFLVTLPLWAAEAAHGWQLGAALCRLTAAVYKLNLFSSTLLLTCISLDRYVVIVQTTKAQNSQAERRRRSVAVCVAVWLLALLLSTPELTFASTARAESQSYCRMVFPPHLGNRTKVLVLALQVSMGFCLPFVVMATCYSVIVATLLRTRSFQKHRAMRVVLAVVAAFVASQAPYNGVLVVEAAQASNLTMTSCEQVKRFDKLGQVLKSLAYLHAGLNPFLYAFVGQRFRRDVLRVVDGCRRRRTASTKRSRSPSSTRATVLSDSDTSQGLSL